MGNFVGIFFLGWEIAGFPPPYETLVTRV